LVTRVETVSGVAQLDSVVYTVCQGSESIQSFSSAGTQTHQYTAGVLVRGLTDACDVVVCVNTRRLYVAEQTRRISVFSLSPPHAQVVNYSCCLNFAQVNFYLFKRVFSKSYKIRLKLLILR